MTTPAKSAVARMYVDRADLSLLNQVITQNAFRRSGVVESASYWSTPPRPSSSPIQETMEVTLASVQLINWIQFSVARYPHLVQVQYYTDLDGWLPLINADSNTEVAFTVVQSLPPQLPNATMILGHRHPQHAYADHWETLYVRLKPVRTQKLRLIMQRPGRPGVGPMDAFGQLIPYSLAIRDLALGYRVAGTSDIPRTLPNPEDPSYQQSFATTNDLLNSPMSFALRQNQASNILGNTDDDADVIWRCEPQPFPNAVVCYYADLRDSNNTAPVIDQIFLDPLNNGAHVTLYYSNDLPVGGFAADANPITANSYGTVGTGPGYLDFGLYGDQDYLVLHSGTELTYDPGLPWWLGLTFSTAFDQGVDSDPHPLVDTGVWQLAVDANGLTVRLTNGDVLSLPMQYQGGQQTSVVLAYDGTHLRIHAVNSSDEASASIAVSVALPLTIVPTITLGADSVTDAGVPAPTTFFNGRIYRMVLKEEIADPADDYLVHPERYSAVPEFANTETAESLNALLRLDRTNGLTSSQYPWSFFGGPGRKYERMSWTPVPRDYTMQRGWMYLPATKARFWKLEFTNLQAEYQDIYMGVEQIVKTFPPDVLADYRSQLDAPAQPPSLGNATQASLVGITPYRDFPQYVSTGGTTSGYTNTEVYVADDFETGQRLLGTRGGNWAYQGWHSGLSAPRFRHRRVHSYTESKITRTAKVVYSVGLRQLVFARASMANQQDTGMYEDMFYDGQNLAQSNWIYDADNEALTSGNSMKASATSVVFNSLRTVRGVQFAASQSQPQQLLPDQEFEDPHMSNWVLVGDATAPLGIQNSALLGSVLPISRQTVLGYWGDIAVKYPTWGDLVASSVTYGDLESSTPNGQPVGGVASLPIPQPTGGRLYAAARVYADHDLHQPLRVQIIDSVTTDVLAEQSIDVKAQQVTEWYTSYTVGTGGASRAVTWGELSGADVVRQSFHDAFHRADASNLGRLDSGQFWQTPTASLHIATNEAAVTVTGQQATFTTDTPWGAYTVVLDSFVAAGSTPASVPMILLGGFVVMNDGRVLDTNTGRVLTTLTISAGDTLLFDFLPTVYVAPGDLSPGVDATVLPWSFTITQNGTFVTTVSGTRAFSGVLGLGGAAGQTFTSVDWAPASYTVPNGMFIQKMPMPTDGALSADGSYWTQPDGLRWDVTQPVTFSTEAVSDASVNTMTAGAGLSPETGIGVDTSNNYGTLSFTIDQLAPTVDPTTYFVAYLDNTLGLRADGALVQSLSTVLGGHVVLMPSAIPSASMTSGDISITFAKASELSSAFKTTYGITTQNQALIFMVNDVVVGVYSGTDIWGSTYRRVVGYNDGSGNYTIITGFGWSPDGNEAAIASTAHTWGGVDGNNTKTWGDVARFVSVNNNPVVVRVVQTEPDFHNDSWQVDTVSLYADPIVWEFSNDGGEHFVPAYDIRNDPDGVLLFPPTPPTEAASKTNRLCYRVSSYGTNAWVSHLAVRPWYRGFMHCVPPRPRGSLQGPNINPYDHYPPIEEDPRFKVWHLPIPREWWFAFRNLDTIAEKWITPVISDEGIVV